MKKLLKQAREMADSLDRSQQNRLLEACGVDAVRLRGKVAKVQRRGRRVLEGVKQLSRAFERHEDVPLQSYVWFTTDDSDNNLGQVIEYDQNDDGEFVWVVADYFDEDDVFDCTEDTIDLIPEDEVDEVIRRLEAAMEEDDGEDVDPDDPDIIEAEIIEED